MKYREQEVYDLLSSNLKFRDLGEDYGYIRIDENTLKFLTDTLNFSYQTGYNKGFVDSDELPF